MLGVKYTVPGIPVKYTVPGISDNALTHSEETFTRVVDMTAEKAARRKGAVPPVAQGWVRILAHQAQQWRKRLILEYLLLHAIGIAIQGHQPSPMMRDNL